MPSDGPAPVVGQPQIHLVGGEVWDGLHYLHHLSREYTLTRAGSVHCGHRANAQRPLEGDAVGGGGGLRGHGHAPEGGVHQRRLLVPVVAGDITIELVLDVHVGVDSGDPGLQIPLVVRQEEPVRCLIAAGTVGDGSGGSSVRFRSRLGDAEAVGHRGVGHRHGLGQFQTFARGRGTSSVVLLLAVEVGQGGPTQHHKALPPTTK
mmetsp:Transcript_1578/g.2530  ORF Transcript_1578/g.2530 Transcript_1578/m.2530 type:complete len:205 (-) Transcript_1578:1701-2315(-)